MTASCFFKVSTCNIKLKSPTNMTLSDRLLMVLKECQIRISISAVHGCKSEVLVIGKFKINCQGFVIGYDIEITIPTFFIYK